MSRLPARDLAEIVERDGALLRGLSGANVLITGAAGFVGGWMLESLLYGADELSIDVSVTALVRDATTFRARLPHLVSDGRLRVLTGDVRTCALRTSPTHIIHAASATSPERHVVDPADIIDTIERGTRRVLELAEEAETRRLLVVSSGSVYERRARSLSRIPEDFATISDGDSLAERFGAAKRRAERAVEDSDLPAAIARIFTVVGPRLPISGQFAVGQFLGDALAGRPVRLTGDGSAVRSYLYAADMTSWCWSLLLRGGTGKAWNVGSDREIAVGDVADHVARLRSPRLEVVRAAISDASARDRYVPDLTRIRDGFGLDAWTGFDEALHRTWTWLKAQRA